MRALSISFALASAVACAALACSDFSSSDGSTGDAGASAPDATTPDAPLAIDAGPGTWCAGQVGVFCDDFEVDRLPPAAGGWTNQSRVGGTTLEIVDEPRPGAPANKALRVAMSVTSPATTTSGLFLKLPPGKKKLAYSFDVLVKDLTPVDAGEYFDVDITRIAFATASSSVNLERKPSAAFELRAWSSTGQPQVVANTPGFAGGTWIRVYVTLEANTGTDYLSVKFGDMITPKSVAAVYEVEKDLSLMLGTETTESGQVELLYDNFLVEAHE
jgi:hypothetical protein